ncbi:MAG TPA: NADP-dependent oxidoreductase [Steroidobacteraceae bacterium]|nr:NADP-dependent oxidoreductase [Steroidobacteraceae bacterium]
MSLLRVAGMVLLLGIAIGPALAGAGDGSGASAVPATMRAAAIDRKGGPEVLTLHELPTPQPGADEVLIALDTVGVGPWDVDVREKLDYWKNRNFPLVLGVDGAGTIAAAGAGVRGFKAGDAVYAYVWDNPKGGFYAEYIALPANSVAHVPAGMSLRDAGAMAVSALTALQGIDDALHMKAGETLIIHGASGGVGSLALQFARLRGARVLATASGDDGVAFVRRYGASAAVDGRHGDIRAAVREFAPGGVDAVLALAGGEALETCIDALKSGGRVAFPSGVRPEPQARAGLAAVRYDALTGPAEYARLNEAIRAAKLEVPIAAEFPLSDAAQAQQRMAAGHVLGKIVLRVR